MFRCVLIGALALAPVGVALAWQGGGTPQGVMASSNSAFQQAVQQQQVRDQLRESQLQQQLHQSVADVAKLPGASDTRLQKQLQQADQAQRDRDRAAQQDQLDRYRDQSALPRVMPQPFPASAHSR